MNGPIYLDYQATTPADPRVVAAMLPWFSEHFGNPHSTAHAFGQKAAEAVETARAEVARAIGASAAEIVFTSGATESNNLAIKGAARFARDQQSSPRRRIVTLATEHKCVLESVRDLEMEGFEPVVLPVDGGGLVDLERLAAALDDRVLLVSVMAAHNEIGVLQDLAKIGPLARAAGALFHTDAAQAFGKIPLDVEAMAIDLMSISGHKIYAPKGIGALYVRRKPRVRLSPLFSGGGQERGLRSGTLAPALCVALGKAASLAEPSEQNRLAGFARHLRSRLETELTGVYLNGDARPRLAGNLNLSFHGVASTDLMAALPDVALSAGSACTSASVEPSYVLRAMGLPQARQDSAVRLGIGRFTTQAELDTAADRIVAAVKRLRGKA
jgi:cysteine desulfurase